MKCVRRTETKQVEKLDNAKAAELITAGAAEPVAKKVWKEEVRDAGKRIKELK